VALSQRHGCQTIGVPTHDQEGDPGATVPAGARKMRLYRAVITSSQSWVGKKHGYTIDVLIALALTIARRVCKLVSMISSKNFCGWTMVRSLASSILIPILG